MMPKFHHWVHLNEEGKKIYGSVFPDGVVPVKVMIPVSAKLGGKVTKMFKVDLEQLSGKQIEELLNIMNQKFNAPKNVIKQQLDKDGYIPLRENLTSGAGTDQMGLFI